MSILYYAAAGTVLTPPVINFTRKKPALAGSVLGANNGNAITTHPAGYALVFDTLGNNAGPTALGGSWNSRTVFSSALGSDDLSVRLSTKIVTLDEGIPACAGGSRRSIRIYTDYALDIDPVVDFINANGGVSPANFPSGLDFELNLDGTTPVPGLVIGFSRRVGTGTFSWTAPLGSNPHNQNTTAVAGSAETSTTVSSWAGQTISVGTTNDWCTITVLLAGEKE